MRRLGAISLFLVLAMVPAPTNAHRSVRHYLPPMWVTGYDLRGTTASGVAAGPGICAADRRYIPQGVFITVPGRTHRCRVLDTGVVGWAVDIWFNTAAECYRVTGEVSGAYWESR